MFAHNLDEKLDLIVNFFIPPNPFAVAIEAYDAWNIAMCLHSFKQFECSGIKSIQRVLGALDHLLTYGKGHFHQTIDDRSMVVLSLLDGVVSFPRLELCLDSKCPNGNHIPLKGKRFALEGLCGVSSPCP